MQDARSLIHQAHTENWEELDLLGMNLTGLQPETDCLTGLRSLILGKEDVGGMEGWLVIDCDCER